MPELRKDPITGRWVIISSERGKRPVDFQDQRGKKRGGFCPFCAGNERTTPNEVLAYRPASAATPNSPGWRLRTVPNKFPALQIEGDLGKQGEGIFDKMNGIGKINRMAADPRVSWGSAVGHGLVRQQD